MRSLRRLFRSVGTRYSHRRNTQGQNNGQISASIDHISGQQVNYTYDVLKRLTAAATTGGTPWGEAYTYDGFGNLNAATVTQGSGVYWANASDPATNRLIGVSYDANGNNITPIGPCCVTTYRRNPLGRGVHVRRVREPERSDGDARQRGELRKSPSA